uniref:Uncharacterized protein n=1 Tax=Panagrolaimus sp. JU765 TaxID=591449 RepID=A0AC34R853_9BILA
MSIIKGDDLNVSQSNSDSESLEEGLNDQEELDAQYYHALETKNLVLRRNMPRLYDAQGQDVTNTFILLQERINDLTLGNQQLEFKFKEKVQKKRSVEKTTRVDGQAQEQASNTEVESSDAVDDQSQTINGTFWWIEKRNVEHKEVETKDGIKKENASLHAELRLIQDEKMTIQKELMDVTEKFEKLEEEHAVLQEQMENGSQNRETVELLRAKKRIRKLDSKIIATAEENENLVSMIEKLKTGIEKQEKTYGDSLERIHVELEQMRNALSQNQQKEEEYQLQEVELKMLMVDKANHERRKQQVQVYEQRIKEYEKNMVNHERRKQQVQVYEKRIKEYEKTMVKLADRSKTLHEDCVKFGNYIQSIVTAAATGKYDKMKRPDNVDESAHAIIMDLLEGTSDEIKKKFEYSLEVLKEIHGKMSKSR